MDSITSYLDEFDEEWIVRMGILNTIYRREALGAAREYITNMPTDDETLLKALESHAIEMRNCEPIPEEHLKIALQAFAIVRHLMRTNSKQMFDTIEDIATRLNCAKLQSILRDSSLELEE